MSFLAPLFLAALAALAVPVLVHLTRRERGAPTPFPSLMFLERIPFEETSRRRVRHWALLALRALALALLVVAFARPFVERGRLASAGGPGAEEVVLLLDRSHSMEGGDRWSEAVDQAREVVRSLRPQDRLTLIAFAETPSALHRSTDDLDAVVATLDALTTGSLATRLAPAIRLAASVLASSRLPRRRVVVVSDLQRTAWSGDPDAALPPGTAVEAIAVGDERPENLALADLELDRRPAGGRERVAVGARLVNTGPLPRSVRVLLTVDDIRVDETTAEAPAGGATALAFDAFTLTDAYTRGEVRIADGDGGVLRQDDALAFVASPGGALSVLIVDPLGPGDSNLHLRRALSVARAADFSVRTIRGAPAAADLASTDVAVLNGGFFPSGEAGDRLRAFVEDGGGLLFALGESGAAPSDPRAGETRSAFFRLPPTPAEHADLLPVSVGGVRDGPPEGFRLGFVDRDHAVFGAFRGPRSGDFSRARFFRARRLTVGDGRVAARFDDGAPALVEGRRGRGRVLVWASGLDRYWNDLPLQPVYLPFLHRAIRFLGGRGDAPAWHVAGATVNLDSLAAAAGASPVPDGAVAMAPGGGSTPLASPLLRLDRRGFWEIRAPGARPDRPMALAVNVDARESDLTRLDVEEFLAALRTEAPAAGASQRVAGAADGAEPAASEVEGRQSFWRYLLAAAFAALAAETLLSNRLSREQVKERAAEAG